MSVKTFIVETASIKAGYAIKNGSAEKGVVAGTADSVNLGISKGNVASEESFAVGDQIDVALIGEVCLAVAGGTVTKGLKLMSDANGKMVDGSGGTNPFAVALENAVAGETLHVVITATG